METKRRPFPYRADLDERLEIKAKVMEHIVNRPKDANGIVNLTLRDLARHAGISPSTAAWHINKLIKDGVLEKISSKGARYGLYRLVNSHNTKLMSQVTAKVIEPTPAPISPKPLAVSYEVEEPEASLMRLSEIFKQAAIESAAAKTAKVALEQANERIAQLEAANSALEQINKKYSKYAEFLNDIKRRAASMQED